MAETFQTADGRTLVRSMQGWREVSDAEASILDESTLTAVGNAAAAAGSETLGLLESAAGFVRGGEFGTGFRRAMIQHGSDRSAAARAEIEQRRMLRPEATAGGRAITFGLEDIATGGVILPAVVALASKRLATGAAKRAAARQADEAGEFATREAADPSLGSLLDELPQTQRPMSQAEAGATLDAIENVPRYRVAAQTIKEKIFKNSRLSGDQARLIESGAVARSGFKLLPGQSSGNNIMVDIVETVPQAADIFSGTLAENGRLLMEKTAKAVGLEAKDWGRDILGQARAKVGAMFDRVEAAIPDTTLGDDLAGALDDVLTTRERKLFDLAGDTSVSGTDLMELRSLVNAELSAARKDSAEGIAARTLEQTLEELDDIIKNAIDDPAIAELWAEARQRWRMVLALDRPGVITPEGDVSLKRLVGAMEKQFPNEFRRTLQVSGEALPMDMRDLMEYARVARSFASNLPNSGTATRNILAKLVSNPAAQKIAGGTAGISFLAALVGD